MQRMSERTKRKTFHERTTWLIVTNNEYVGLDWIFNVSPLIKYKNADLDTPSVLFTFYITYFLSAMSNFYKNHAIDEIVARPGYVQ